MAAFSTHIVVPAGTTRVPCACQRHGLSTRWFRPLPRVTPRWLRGRMPMGGFQRWPWPLHSVHLPLLPPLPQPSPQRLCRPHSPPPLLLLHSRRRHRHPSLGHPSARTSFPAFLRVRSGRFRPSPTPLCRGRPGRYRDHPPSSLPPGPRHSLWQVNSPMGSLPWSPRRRPPAQTVAGGPLPRDSESHGRHVRSLLAVGPWATGTPQPRTPGRARLTGSAQKAPRRRRPRSLTRRNPRPNAARSPGRVLPNQWPPCSLHRKRRQ